MMRICPPDERPYSGSVIRRENLDLLRGIHIRRADAEPFDRVRTAGAPS